MIKFRCSHCQQKIGAPDDYAGKRVRCSKCRQPIRVPSPQQAPPGERARVIKFRCPSCSQKIGVSEKYAGKRVRCLKCRQPMTVPSFEQEAVRQPVKAPAAEADEMLAGPAWSEDLLSSAAAMEAAAPPEDTLRVAPADATADDVRSVKCPACSASNRSDTQFCTTCGETMPTMEAPAPAMSAAAKVPLAFGASVGFTLGGAIGWAIIASLVGLGWVNWMSLVVASLAGVGLTLFSDKRNAALGLLAGVIGLFGMVCGKVAIAKWAVLPAMERALEETDWQDMEPTEEHIAEGMKNPHSLFRAACFQLVDEGEFEDEFARKVMATHYDGRAPIGEAEQVMAAIKKVEARLKSWDEEQKREALRAQYVRDVKAMKNFGKAVIGAIAESTEQDANVGQGWRQTAREANELVTGQRSLAQTRIGFFFALIGTFRLLDLVFFPMGVWSAYKIGSGRE